jgi:uncharacterized membrane protein YdjX (TVP38/TMEM64 family)
MSRLRAALPLILLVLAGLVLFASGALDRFHPEQLIAHQDQMRAHIDAHPWTTRIVFIGLLTLVMATGIPGGVVVILAGGFAFGVVEGTLYSSIGLTLGSLILYLASRYAFGSGSRHPPAIVERLRHGFARHPVSYTLFLRFIPVMPFGGVTIGLAWLRCSLRLFLGATWLGGTVTLVFENLIGAGISDAMSHGDRFGFGLLRYPQVWLPLCGVVLLALLPMLIERIVLKRAQARENLGLPHAGHAAAQPVVVKSRAGDREKHD